MNATVKMVGIVFIGLIVYAIADKLFLGKALAGIGSGKYEEDYED